MEDAFNDGMDVVSCSLGVIAITPASQDFVASAFEKAAEGGMVIAVSAGNDGSNETAVPHAHIQRDVVARYSAQRHRGGRNNQLTRVSTLGERPRRFGQSAARFGANQRCILLWPIWRELGAHRGRHDFGQRWICLHGLAGVFAVECLRARPTKSDECGQRMFDSTQRPPMRPMPVRLALSSIWRMAPPSSRRL